MPFGAGFVGQQFRASFIAEPSLTPSPPPLTDSVFMSATNVVIPCGEPTGANGRTDGRAAASAVIFVTTSAPFTSLIK